MNNIKFTSSMLCLLIAISFTFTASANEQSNELNDLSWSTRLHFRLRPEFRVNSDLNEWESDDTYFALQRARIGFDVKLDSKLEAFVQIQDCRNWGQGNSTTAYLQNIDLHQAWVNWGLFEKISLRLGRQQLIYGDQRLIGAFEWSNQGRVFDAVKLKWNYTKGWLDIFTSVMVPDGGRDLGNATFFSGLYHSIVLGEKLVEWDHYMLFLKGINAEIQMPVFGTRLRYAKGPINGGFEAAYQTGYNNKKLGVGLKQRAYAFHGDIKYISGIPSALFIKLESNYATGNSGDANTIERFNNLFPTNHIHYGYMDLQNWCNAMNFSIGAGLQLGKNTSLQLDYWNLNRSSTEDSWFDAGGYVLLPVSIVPSSSNKKKGLGSEIDVTVNIVINKHLKIASGLSAFMPGGFAERLGDDTQYWGFAMLTFDAEL